MNALEYKSIIATADSISFAEPLYLDGRLFPYEHRLDDLFYYHGRYVYRALKEYRNVKARASRRPIFGIVKRPSISVLWHFARYVFLSNLSNKLGIDKTALLLTELKSPYIHDLALHMLMSAKGICKGQGLATTLAVIRSYWVLVPKFLQFADEYLKTDEERERWHKFLEREHDPEFWHAVFRYVFDKDENFKNNVENLAYLDIPAAGRQVGAACRTDYAIKPEITMKAKILYVLARNPAYHHADEWLAFLKQYYENPQMALSYAIVSE